ncbi:MAG: hypothetical protein J0L76_18660 [Rhodobacterales bacterium]|nr:hypothetical protein [Rhodobacterales bacterium]
MSENKPIQHYGAHWFRWKDIEHLSNLERTAFVAACFCVNEVNALRRITLFSMSIDEECKLVKDAEMVQRQVLLRVLTGKLFEFLELYKGLSGRKSESKVISDALSRLNVAHSTCVRHPGYKYAKKIRNSQAHHYDLRAIEQTASRVEKDARCEFFLATEGPNSFFPFAEHLVFNPDPKGRLDDELEDGEADAIIGQWIEWINLVSEFVHTFLDTLVEELMSKRRVDFNARRRLEFLSPQMKVATDFRLPVFVRAFS